MRKIFILMVLGLTLIGCHTIRPLNTPQQTILSEIPEIKKSVGLIMDKQYQTYTSKDRGNPLADPQRYMVGEALAPLTKIYFERAASHVTTYESFDEIPKTQSDSDLYVNLKVDQFDNTVRLTEQRIDVKLTADLYDNHRKPLQTIQAQGMANGGIFGNEVNQTVSTALQLALSNLIREIKSNVN